MRAPSLTIGIAHVSVIRQFLKRVKSQGVRRSGTVTTVSMGRERTFEAFDVKHDTFVFEKGVATRLSERPSVLIVEKSALRPRLTAPQLISNGTPFEARYSIASSAGP